MEILYEVNKKGATVIVVSHDAGLIKSSGKRVVSMNTGRIINDTENKRMGGINEK